MSAQLPLHYNYFEGGNYQQFINFTEQLLHQQNIESQLILIISNFEQILSCAVKLWVNDFIYNPHDIQTNEKIPILSDLTRVNEAVTG